MHPPAPRPASYAGRVRKSTKSSASATSDEDLPRRRPAAVDVRRAEPLPQRRVLGLDQRRHQLGGDDRPGVEPHAVVDPLPDLRPGDLGGGGVLHQVVDGDGAVAAQPRLEVLQADLDVAAQALLRDVSRGGGDRQQVLGRDVDVVAVPVELVRTLAEHVVEHLAAQRHEVGVRHPRAVETRCHLTLLVLAHLRERALVDLLVVPARDERGHPAHRERAATVAGPHQQVAVGAHERGGHRHRVPVGQDEARAGVAEVLDDAEQVVPPAGVEARGVVAQLVEDLVHLEGRGDRLDQDGGADRAARYAEVLLRSGEHLVPQPRLEVATPAWGGST